MVQVTEALKPVDIHFREVSKNGKRVFELIVNGQWQSDHTSLRAANRQAIEIKLAFECIGVKSLINPIVKAQ